MVGVPWSTACTACRSRRKRSKLCDLSPAIVSFSRRPSLNWIDQCDGRKPSCSQCMKRGHPCPRYVREMRVVLVDPGRKKASSTGDPPAGVVTKPPSPQTSKTLDPPKVRILLDSYVRSAYLSQTRGRYMDMHLPSHAQTWPKLPTDLSVQAATSWLQVIASLSITDVLLENAVTALALAHLERLQKRRGGHQSSVLYSRAMAELSRGCTLIESTVSAIARWPRSWL